MHCRPWTSSSPWCPSRPGPGSWRSSPARACAPATWSRSSTPARPRSPTTCGCSAWRAWSTRTPPAATPTTSCARRGRGARRALRLAGRVGAERRAAPVLMFRRLVAEGLGTGLLVTVVVGSGIAASRLSPADVGLQLLENSLATALGLAVLIVVLGPVSGAHLNPVVTVARWLAGRRDGTGPAGARCGAVRRRAVDRRRRRRAAGERHVRRAAGSRAHRPLGRRPVARRGGRDRGSGGAGARPGAQRTHPPGCVRRSAPTSERRTGSRPAPPSPTPP